MVLVEFVVHTETSTHAPFGRELGLYGPEVPTPHSSTASSA